MEYRLRQVERAHPVIARLHNHRLHIDHDLRHDPLLALPRENQQSTLGARVLKGRAHESVNQSLEVHVRGEGLRDLDEGCQVELLDRRPAHARVRGG